MSNRKKNPGTFVDDLKTPLLPGDVSQALSN